MIFFSKAVQIQLKQNQTTIEYLSKMVCANWNGQSGDLANKSRDSVRGIQNHFSPLQFRKDFDFLASKIKTRELFLNAGRKIASYTYYMFSL